MDKAEKNAQRASRFRNIADRITRMIDQGRILPDDRLPAERQLAALLEVSRASVREALRMLEQKGLIEIRLGKNGGAYVKPPSHGQLSDDMDMLLRFDRLSLDQIAEFREAIECGITALAARKAGPEDIRRLKYRLATARSIMESGQGWVDEFIDADKAVHLDIADIAGNPLFSQALAAALGLRRYFCRFLKLHPSMMESNLDDLIAIVRAMENHQPEIARCRTMAHIGRFNEAIG